MGKSWENHEETTASNTFWRSTASEALQSSIICCRSSRRADEIIGTKRGGSTHQWFDFNGEMMFSTMRFWWAFLLLGKRIESIGSVTIHNISSSKMAYVCVNLKTNLWFIYRFHCIHEVLLCVHSVCMCVYIYISYIHNYVYIYIHIHLCMLLYICVTFP